MGRLLSADEIERMVRSREWASQVQPLLEPITLRELWQTDPRAALVGYPTEQPPTQILSPLGVGEFRAAIVDLEGTLGGLRALREGKTLLGRIWAALAARRTISSEGELKAFWRTIPLSIASPQALRSLGLQVNGRASDGYVLVPLWAPLPEGVRRRVSTEPQSLTYLMAPMEGAGISRPAETTVALKGMSIDLRPLLAVTYAGMRDSSLRQGVAGIDAWGQLLGRGTLHRLVSVVLEYLEGLARPDPVLGRQRRVALLFGRDIYGAPPRYLLAKTVSVETVFYAPDGSLLAANVEIEFGEYWDSEWEG